MRTRYSVLFLGLGLAVFYFDEARQCFKTEGDESGYEKKAAVADGGTTSADSSGRTLSGKNRTAIARTKTVWAKVDPYLLIASGIAALLTAAYVEFHFYRLLQDVHLLGFTDLDLFVGGVIIYLAIDATRRAFGWIIALVTIGSILYATNYVGPNLPSFLRHSGFDLERISSEGAISLSGVYHETLMGIGSTWVAIFIMFAGIAKAYGLMDFILDVGRELGKSLTTGVVQIAVIASMIMGSITGSAAANTATTGSFTIPMMQDQKVRDDYAAAIEAVASAGGQMLPPVMGVAAFLMADIIGVSYLRVIQAGVIPAALFYLSVGIAVHFTVLKFGWTSKNTGSFNYGMLTRGAHFAIPLFVLLYLLVVMRWTPLTAGLYTIITMIVVGLLTSVVSKVRASEIDSGVVKEESKTILLGLRRGGLEMAPLVGVLAAMGIIIEMLTQTGLAQRVSTAIVGMGGGLLLVVLLLAMVASILFGLGMPTPAAYILVVILVAPGVMEMGVPEITTHMFVFYFAMLSAITPPVAISVAVGSRIANTDFITSCINALRIGAPGFLIPFALVANESLIYWSSTTLIEFPVVLAGTIALIVATVRFDGARLLSIPWRGFYGLLAFIAMFGGLAHIGVQVGAAIVIVAGLAHAKYVVGYDTEAQVEATATD
nr:TRAP transporter fused permease subunit [Natronorubrum sediminis]